MSRRGQSLAWLGGLLLLGLLVAWFFVTFKRVDRSVNLPPRGEASFNPLYALKQVLRADGQPVLSRQRLQLDTIPLGRRDTVVIHGDPRTLTGADLDRLMGFAETGGHVVLQLPPWSESGNQNGAAALAGRLPILPGLREPACLLLRWPDKTTHRLFCGAPRFALKGSPKLLAGWEPDDGAGHVYARFQIGEGSVDLLSEFDALTNEGLQLPRNAAFTRQLLAPNWGAGTIHLIYAADVPPLWRWLLEHGWRALLPAFLCLLLWLWMRAQQFGPLLPAPQPPRRSLLEHLEASGEHLLRYGHLGALHRALLKAVHERLRRRDPLAAALEGETQAALIGKRTGLPANDVRVILDTRPPRDAHDFRHRIARLIDLRKRL
ncbi:MAG: DUF4350 domain-containing protein [Proteobacteria bacterium]|nr:DUF4350 domain-containing protein [Pseudomonadota bacterium]